MAEAVLSSLAGDDLENIFRFGIYRFGEKHAVSYRRELFSFFDDVAKMPRMYPVFENGPVRRAVFKSSVIYFEMTDAGIKIVRILGQQDPGSAFG